MGDTQEAVYDYSFSSNATTTANQQLTAIATNTGGYYTSYGFNSFENVEGFVDISVNVYPTYKITVDDIMEGIGVNLDRKNADGGINSVYVEATLEETEDEVTIETNTLYYKIDDNGYVGLKYDFNSDNEVIGFSFSDANQSIILSYGLVGDQMYYRIAYDSMVIRMKSHLKI